MPKPAAVYNTVIVDDNEQFRTGIATYLKKLTCINIVARFADGSDFIHKMDQIKFDLVFMDLKMPIMDGDRATRVVMKKYPATKIIGLSMQDDGYSVKRMLESGAWAFASKKFINNKIPEIVNMLMKGKRYVDPAAAVNYTLYKNKLKRKTNVLEAPESPQLVEPPGEIPDVKLTPAERQIIEYLTKGFTHKEIAIKLSRSSRTIDNHKYNIMLKLNAHNATEIISLAYKYKFI